MSTALAALALTYLTPAVPVAEAEPGSVARLAGEYVELVFQERDLDGAFRLLAEDIAFVDPTAEVWGGPAAKGIVGRAALRRLTESWNLESSHFDIEHSFVAGEYALFAGTLSWQAKGAPPVGGVAFCSVLRVEGGEITERTDYCGYGDLLGQSAEALGKAAGRIFDAYVALDVDALGPELAPDVVLEDPIGASRKGAAQGEPVRGKVQVLAALERARQHASSLDFEPAMAFASGTHAFFLGTTRARLTGGGTGDDPREVALEYSSVHILRLADGNQLVQHRRYIDHGAIDRQIAEQQPRH